MRSKEIEHFNKSAAQVEESDVKTKSLVLELPRKEHAPTEQLYSIFFPSVKIDPESAYYRYIKRKGKEIAEKQQKE